MRWSLGRFASREQSSLLDCVRKSPQPPRNAPQRCWRPSSPTTPPTARRIPTGWSCRSPASMLTSAALPLAGSICGPFRRRSSKGMIPGLGSAVTGWRRGFWSWRSYRSHSENSEKAHTCCRWFAVGYVPYFALLMLVGISGRCVIGEGVGLEVFPKKCHIRYNAPPEFQKILRSHCKNLHIGFVPKITLDLRNAYYEKCQLIKSHHFHFAGLFHYFFILDIY